MAEVMGEGDEEPTKYIYLIRHGETSYNAQGIMRGWDDPGLNEAGRADALAAGKALDGVKLDALYVSDLKRATQTAAVITKGQQGLPRMIETDLLRTMDAGTWTGRPLTEIDPKMAALQEKWRTKPDTEAPGGESWTQFQKRQIKVWAAILTDKAQHVAVVAHLRNSVWALGYALMDGNPLSGDNLLLLNRITQKPARLSMLTYSKRDGLKIEDVNTLEARPE